MRGIIFKDTLRHNWVQLVAWGGGMGSLGFFIVALMQDSEIIQQYSDLLGSMPPAILQIFGASDVAMFQSVEGYVSSLFVSYAMLMLAVYAVIAGLSITMNEEDEGILDVLMALPISRQTVIVEKYGAFAVISAGVVALCFILPLIALILFNVEFDMGKVFISIMTLYPGLLFITAITALVSVVVRRKFVAIGVVAGFIVASYFLNFIGGAASDSIVETLRGLSVFYYTEGQSILEGTFNPIGLIALVIIACFLVGMTTQAFQRRDIGL